MSEPLTAVCSADAEGPFTLRVLGPGGEELLRIEYPWEQFRPSSAGHRLIEHDYMIVPSTHEEPERVAGWAPAPGMGWSQIEIGRAQEWHARVLPVEQVMGR